MNSHHGSSNNNNNNNNNNEDIELINRDYSMFDGNPDFNDILPDSGLTPLIDDHEKNQLILNPAYNYPAPMTPLSTDPYKDLYHKNGFDNNNVTNKISPIYDTTSNNDNSINNFTSNPTNNFMNSSSSAGVNPGTSATTSTTTNTSTTNTGASNTGNTSSNAINKLGDDYGGFNKIAPFRKRRENTAPKTRPAFVMKVWSMVNDPKNHDYIRWNSDGETFQVYHREEFMKEIIPKYFKHNNFASFVRQLNMYGWHKVQDINSGTLKDDKNHEEIWQFKNPNFIQGREDLLDKIVRNKTIQEEDNTSTSNTLQLILNEIEKIKMNQIAVNEDLKRIRQDNKTIWHENYLRRERQKQQSQTLDQILKFLATVYGNKQQFLDEQKDNPYATGEYLNNQSFLKPRLMLMDQEFKSPEDGISPMHKPSESSIEEIIRSYNTTPNESSTNVNKMFQQMISDNNGHINNNTTANSRFLNDKINGKYNDKINDNKFNENNNKINETNNAINNVHNTNTDTNTNTTDNNNTNNISNNSNYNHKDSILNTLPNIDISQSPRHFFPELNFNNSQLSQDNDQDNKIDGIEQSLNRQGQSIQQVQSWIQKLAQQNNPQDLSHINNIDDFDVNEFLQENNTTPETGTKRSIEEIHDDDHEEKKRKI
jgi:heat shock transcription factor